MNTDLLLDGAIRKYGEDAQVIKAAEECAELSAALLQCRSRGTEASYEHACEEIADVGIMLSQLKRIFDEDKISKYESAKLKRLSERIGYKE